ATPPEVSPRAAEANYPRPRPQSAMVPATREIICLTERSRVGDVSWPRKYFWATMFVEFCDRDFGHSTYSCLNEPTAAVRSSHSTASNGCTPGRVNRRRTLKASAARCDFVSVVCGDVCSMVLAISLGTDLNLWGGGCCASARTEPGRCGDYDG